MLVLQSSSPFSPWVPVQLGMTVLDRAMAKVTIEELTHASNMWWWTYMSSIVMARVAGSVEMNHDNMPSIDAPFNHY